MAPPPLLLEASALLAPNPPLGARPFRASLPRASHRAVRPSRACALARSVAGVGSAGSGGSSWSWSAGAQVKLRLLRRQAAFELAGWVSGAVGASGPRFM